jgi:hypothetical protein
VSDHGDLWDYIQGHSAEIAEFLDKFVKLEERVSRLEKSTPEARQLQYEADVAAADLAASGYDDWPPVGADRHGPGCKCPYCPPDDDEPGEYDPGPEVDDEGGMTERRGAVLLYEEEL